MASTIRPEDRFDGKDHFIAWQVRIRMVLEENEVSQFVVKESKHPDVESNKST